MKVQYDGPEAEVTVFGRTFKAGEPTDISDLAKPFQAKLSNNQTFSVVGKPRAAADPVPTEA